MNLDTLAATVVGFISVCLALLHAYSGRERANWPNLPQYLRYGIIVTGAVFMVWSVILFNGYGPVIGAAAHIDPLTLIALLVFAYTCAAAACFIIRLRMPAATWHRLEWLRSTLQAQPGARPLVVTESDVTDIAHAVGIAAVPPGGGGQAAVHEASRFGRAAARRQP